MTHQRSPVFVFLAFGLIAAAGAWFRTSTLLAQPQPPTRPTPPAAAQAAAPAAAAETTSSTAASSGDTSATITDAGPGRVSLDLKGVDIVELLKILSVKMDTNIVPTKEVTGRVNIFLNNVTIEDALDIILINNSLAMVRDKGIITVMSLEKYNQLYGKRYNETRRVRMYQLKHASPKDIMATLTQIKSDVGKVIIDEPSGTLILIDVPEILDLMEKTVYNLERPKLTEVFELKYAKAEDIKAQLAPVLTPGTSEVEVDVRTNKIVISDLPDKMKKIKQMVEEFDAPTRQVLIEAQIVQIALNDRMALGVNWERLFANGKLRNIDFTGKFPMADTTNLGTFSLGTMDQNDFFLVLQYLNQITKTNILSRPRIAVLNNQEATILIGAKEVYFSQTQSQSSVTTTTAESVNFVDVGVQINVTPTINEDGFVTMKIRPEISSVRETATSPLGSTVPVVETSQAETSVKVKDNVMVMIAGLMKEDIRESVSVDRGHPPDRVALWQ
jgi:type II secretory pathway component GspD/PulD (secretin)